jgi:aminoglycoside phosphotransferase (APT) family kinase protein
MFTCHDAAVLGAQFVVMERAAGRPMLDWYTKFPHCLRIADRVVALQRRLHTFDTERLASAFARRGVRLPVFDLAASLERLSLRVSTPGLEWTRPGLDWLIEKQPDQPSELVICHGDLHPGNILASDTEVSAVIDWSSVKVADPARDIGWTRQMLIGRRDLHPIMPQKLLSAVQRLVLMLYDRAIQNGGQADTNVVAYYEALRSFGRGTSRAASRPRSREQKGFASFRRVTGIALA